MRTHDLTMSTLFIVVRRSWWLAAWVAMFSCMFVLLEGLSVFADEPTQKDVAYGSIGETSLKLDFYAPTHRRQERPLVIWIHGGAWRSGDKSNVPLVRLRDQGFAIASVEYRLSPVARFPAQIHDIKTAIRFLRANSKRFELDADRFVLAGSSAGGHLAVLAAVSDGVPELSGLSGSQEGESSQVQAVVSFFGAGNLQSILAQSTPFGLDVRIPALKLLLGDLPERQPELARLASPVAHVDTSDPPLWLIHGDQDPQMPIHQSHELVDVYEKCGLPVRFEVVHGGKHGGDGFFTDEQLQRIGQELFKLKRAEDSNDHSLTWSELPSLPDSLGFAGPFVGNHDGTLFVAGGANFPDSMPWNGGTKVWYDEVFVLDRSSGQWRNAGKLPGKLGYGVSLSMKDGVVCLGGSDAKQHHSEVFVMRLENGSLTMRSLPSLPKPCANFCGAILGSKIMVAGGIETPGSTSALKTFWSLDFDSVAPSWQELDTWPGQARMLAVGAVQDDAFYLVGGAALEENVEGKPVRRYLSDAYRYKPSEGWKRIADLPRPCAAAPTPAPAFGRSGFLVLGGDDGSRVDFQPIQNHPGFSRDVFVYDSIADSWESIGEMPASVVTTTTTFWNNRFVLPSGEVRPGVRSPKVWSLETR